MKAKNNICAVMRMGRSALRLARRVVFDIGVMCGL